MNTRLDGPVVVAVDGTEDAARAVAYGAREASRRGRALRLVHVLHESVAWTPAVPAFTHETLHAAGAACLEDAVTIAQELTGGELEIHLALERGPRVPVLLEHASDASLVVVGTRHATWKRVATGSTSVSLAARAMCPVVCVPGAWTPTLEHDRVLVGLDGSPVSQDVLATAYEEAESRAASLVVLHAWRPRMVYDATTARLVESEWRRLATLSLERMLDVQRAAHPDVKCSLELHHRPPADTLARATADTDLVVLGRRGHGGALGLHLGGIARTLIRTSSCPVEIVPVPRET